MNGRPTIQSVLGIRLLQEYVCSLTHGNLPALYDAGYSPLKRLKYLNTTHPKWYSSGVPNDIKADISKRLYTSTSGNTVKTQIGGVVDMV